MISKRFPVLILSILVILAMFSLVFAACAKPAATTAPATSAPPPAAEAIEFIFSSNTPASAPMSQYEQKMFDMIAERSQGKVKFTTYWASTLVPDAESWNGLLSGICDILHWTASDKYQRLNWGIVTMPFIGWPSMEAGGKMMTDLIEKHSALKDEFKGAEILSAKLMPPVQLHTTSKVVKTVNDVKGLKLICDGPMAEFMMSVGAVPANIMPGDFYTSLNSGLADGIVNHFPVVSVFGCLPLFKSHTIFGDGGMQFMGFGVVMNPKSWAKLTPDLQKLFKDTAQEIWFDEGIEVEYSEINKYTKEAQDAGHTMNLLTKAEIEQWSDACAPLQKTWLAAFEKEGYPAEAIFNDAKQMIAAYK